MRVRIGGFLRFGTRAQFGAQAHTIVAIARIRGEQLLDDQQKLPEALLTIAEGGAERLLQVSRRGMEGTAERLPIGREDITVLRTDARCDIDQIAAGAGGEVQEYFSRWRQHRVSPGWLRCNALPSSPEVEARGHRDGEACLRQRPRSEGRLAGDRHPGLTAGCSGPYGSCACLAAYRSLRTPTSLLPVPCLEAARTQSCPTVEPPGASR